VPVGDAIVDLSFTRQGRELIVKASGPGATGLRLASLAADAKTEGMTLHIPLPPVEAAISQKLPPFGQETMQMKVLDEKIASHSLTLTLAAQASSQQTLLLKQNAAGIRIHTDDAKIEPEANGVSNLAVSFPNGSGYVTKTVTISW
jgi:hypothetical protein